MKNKIKFLQFVAILFFSFSAYSQVTVSVQNLQYTNNGQSTVSPANCGNIDLASSTSTSINLGINLSKPNGQVVGLSDLRVYTKKSSSDSRVERSWVQIQESFWSTSQPNNTYSSSASFSINSSEFNVSGGTLFVVFKSNGGIEYQTTCSFTITKTPLPSFSLSPTSLSLPCGDTSSRVFTITPANIPSGANVTYQWSYSGWSLISQTATSRTLQPSSGTSLPSTVSVTPSINGVAQTTKTCTITRSAIASSGSIPTSSNVCTTGTFTFTGLLAGQSVNWSLSNSTAGTLSTTTGTTTIFTKTGGGAVILTATVSNSCGQSYTKTSSILAGPPQAFSLVRASNETCDGIKFHYVPFEIPNRNPLNTYTFNIAPIPGVTITQSTQTYNGIIQNVLRFPKTYVGPVDFTVSSTNSCGNFTFLAEEEINSCSGLGLRLSNTTVKQFVVFPNPAKDIVTIELKDQENQTEKNTTISGELFDMMGQSKSKVQILDSKATFSVRELKKGIYILKIYINDQVEIHQIAVE